MAKPTVFRPETDEEQQVDLSVLFPPIVRR